MFQTIIQRQASTKNCSFYLKLSISTFIGKRPRKRIRLDGECLEEKISRKREGELFALQVAGWRERGNGADALE